MKFVSTFIALAIGFLFTDAFAQTATIKTPAPATTVKEPTPVTTIKDRVSTRLNDSTIKISGNMVVPANQTFYVYDENKQLIGAYAEGNTLIIPPSKTRAAKALNCVEISCPKTFKKGTVCWRCR